MANANIDDLFGDSDDDDDFQPSARPQPETASPRQGGETAGPGTLNDEDDDEDDFRDRPAPRQPQQLRDYSDEDEEAIVREIVEERPKGPPQEMSGALLPVPAINKLRLLQTSKFLAVQTLPMTPENLKLERESAVMDEETGEVKYTYKKQMTLRWRKRTLPSGEEVTESNARFVRWSDGSTQLLLGDEVLDMVELDNTGAQQYLFVRHTQPVAFIQGQGQLIKKLHLRPASLSSKFHRQLTEEAARRHVKVNKVKATATVMDPNKLKAEREKAEEERIRSRETLQRRQEREMRKYPAPRREYRPTGITTQFLETIEDEPDYDDGDEVLSADDERPQPSLQRPQALDEAEEREAEARLARAKQDTGSKRPREESEPQEKPVKVGTVIHDDEEEDDIGARHSSKKGRRGGLVFSDSDDE